MNGTEQGTQRLIPMTYDQFAAWLLAIGEGSAGRRKTRAACPMSSALAEITGNEWWVDFVSSEGYGWAECKATGEFCTLPDWAYAFVVSVDRLGIQVPLSGNDAYAILCAWNDEQLNKIAA